MVTGPGQFVGHRPDGYHAIGFSFLARVEGFDLGIVGQAMVGRLMKGPGQITITTLAVILTLLFVITDKFAFHTAGVGSEVSC